MSNPNEDLEFLKSKWIYITENDLRDTSIRFKLMEEISIGGNHFEMGLLSLLLNNENRAIGHFKNSIAPLLNYLKLIETEVEQLVREPNPGACHSLIKIFLFTKEIDIIKGTSKRILNLDFKMSIIEKDNREKWFYYNTILYCHLINQIVPPSEVIEFFEKFDREQPRELRWLPKGVSIAARGIMSNNKSMVIDGLNTMSDVFQESYSKRYPIDEETCTMFLIANLNGLTIKIDELASSMKECIPKYLEGRKADNYKEQIISNVEEWNYKYQRLLERNRIEARLNEKCINTSSAEKAFEIGIVSLMLNDEKRAIKAFDTATEFGCKYFDSIFNDYLDKKNPFHDHPDREIEEFLAWLFFSGKKSLIDQYCRKILQIEFFDEDKEYYWKFLKNKSYCSITQKIFNLDNDIKKLEKGEGKIPRDIEWPKGIPDIVIGLTKRDEDKLYNGLNILLKKYHHGYTREEEYPIYPEAGIILILMKMVQMKIDITRIQEKYLKHIPPYIIDIKIE